MPTSSTSPTRKKRWTPTRPVARPFRAVSEPAKVSAADLNHQAELRRIEAHMRAIVKVGRSL